MEAVDIILLPHKVLRRLRLGQYSSDNRVVFRTDGPVKLTACCPDVVDHNTR